MIVEKIIPSGGYYVADIVGGYLIHRRYFGYPRLRAIRKFVREMREEFGHAIDPYEVRMAVRKMGDRRS